MFKRLYSSHHLLRIQAHSLQSSLYYVRSIGLIPHNKEDSLFSRLNIHAVLHLQLSLKKLYEVHFRLCEELCKTA